MNRRSASILAVVLLLIGGTAGLLAYWKTNQKLGKPGVKVAQQPTYDWAGNVVATNSVYLPEKVLDYESSTGRVTKQELGMLPKDTTYGRRVYRAPDGFQISCSAILMGTDRTSIHKPEYCLVGQGFRIIRQESGIVALRDPIPYSLPVTRLTAVRETKLADGRTVEERALYVYWFVTDGQVASQHGERMLSSAWKMLTTGVTPRWAYISCFAFVPGGDEAKANSEIDQLIAATAPQFQLLHRGTMSAMK